MHAALGAVYVDEGLLCRRECACGYTGEVDVSSNMNDDGGCKPFGA